MLSCFILFQLFSVNFLTILLVTKEIPINNLNDLVNLDVNVLVLKSTYEYVQMKNESWLIMSKVKPIDNEREHKLFENRKNILMADSPRIEALKEIHQDSNLKITEGNGSFTLSGFPINKNINQQMKQKLHLL